ncbi:hypothetical protein G6M87_01190 [Rhizobium rhizogenes]|uniref:hypothetical protein n=1 Tax=Rhizobium rhizogenes TaxID=359 RepID=UPI00080F9F84|nr:hypothetical protein [Rhizobium rhizogenes]OCJ23396.1 hypothetical protein A6U88_28895 [Agrobacterium sp. B131/95]MDJ1638494.1 hypothetical protein [Rhizobium rhizogenes]NTG71839.1 hypothetical protein [Rhizobium rhizogenes]NTI20480.1 hypothetical protein [Rhizobium rhizogenes]QTG04150.1 hypothetical protein G6M87_01190 [Rhizobium rhizogenes]
MRAKLFAAVALGLITTLLAGCAGGGAPGKVAAEHSAAISQIASKKSQKGALLLIRTVDANLMGDQYCSGHIRLRRIDNGKPDKNSAFEDIYSADRWLLPDEKKPKDMQATFLYRVANAASYARSFRPIAPGRYAITYADCQYGISQFSNGVKIEAGGDHDFLFNYVSPLGGASTITVGAGQIIDAGYIRLTGRRSDPTVVSSEASAAEREVMQEVLPEIYTSIRFTKFGS